MCQPPRFVLARPTSIRLALSAAIAAAALAGATPARADPPAGAVEIWIRAFLPDPQNAGAATSYIVPRPNTPGQSMVRLLPTDRLPDRATPACFVTDNRGFSSATGSTARTETRFVVAPVQNGGKVTDRKSVV